MVSVAYYLSKRSNTEIICAISVYPQNNMISGMSIFASTIIKKTARKISVEAFPLMK